MTYTITTVINKGHLSKWKDISQGWIGTLDIVKNG